MTQQTQENAGKSGYEWKAGKRENGKGEEATCTKHTKAPEGRHVEA